MSAKPLLGKRKRRTEVVSQGPGDQPDGPESPERQDVNEIFRRAFEAKFKPLADTKPKQTSEVPEALPEEDEDDEDSAWSGVSDDDEAVEVIQHSSAPTTTGESLSRSEVRAFMSSKPPSSRSGPGASTARNKSAKRGTGEEEDGTEAANLKNDLALQRLLRESHLLDASASDDGPTGRNRLRATELRMQSLGAKSSVLEQKSMPMSHRKGMMAKAARKESERRQEAKENGIILEKPRSAGGTRRDVGRREQGVGGPSIGRFRGGTLSLSKKDVQGIQGSGSSRRGGKGKTRGRR